MSLTVTDTMVLTFLGVFMLCAIIAGIIILVVNLDKRDNMRIRASSELLKTINDYVRELAFIPLQSSYSYSKQLSSKAKLDRMNINDSIITLLFEQGEKDLIRNAISNQEKYEQLESFIPTVEPTKPETIESQRFSEKRYVKEEEKALEEIRDTVKKSVPEFHFRFTYSSPQGRNVYWREKSITSAELKQLLNSYTEREKNRLLAQSQRELMNNKLRYQILQRDNFRCVLCGRTAQDGIVLHVDHIIPVSKGGLTEPNNLRTLCEDCNLGKSDSYNPQGNN